MRKCYCILLIFIAPLAFSGEQWVFLKDGRVCFAAQDASPLTGVLPDGTAIVYSLADIQGRRTPAQALQAVDAIIAEMSVGKHIEEHTARLKVLRAAAVAGLLKHLEDTSLTGQFCALYGLQFCWTRDALEPVLKKFSSTDPKTSQAALSALELNVSWQELARRLKDFADDANINRAAAVFRIVEPFYPDPTMKRILRLLSTPAGRGRVAPLFSRYFGHSFQAGALEMAASEKVEEQRAGAIALIVQSARQDKVRKRLSELIRSTDLDLRQLSVEYYARVGAPEDLPLLETAATESDPYVQAALKAAVGAIKSRAVVLNSLPQGRSPLWQELKESTPIHEKLAKCLRILSEKPARGDFEAAWLLLDSTDQVELPHRYGAEEAEVASERESSELMCLRIGIERLLQVAPCGALEEVNDGASSKDDDKSKAARFVPPISGYFDTTRKSFGHVMPKEGVFSNSVHIGDDCGWGRELRTVVCIGNGVVRHIGFITSWGHIIVIEHRMPDGTQVCSLYAHLSAFIYVKPGDVVEAGQKIGTIGRPMSLENGGYGSHLHFGIHQGPFSPGHWISGYIQPAIFTSGDHAWLDPQKFLPANK